MNLDREGDGGSSLLPVEVSGILVNVPKWAAAAGGAVWILRLAFIQPSPLTLAWGVELLLLAPLCLVPLTLLLVAPQAARGASGPAPLSWRAAVLLQPGAALLLMASFAFDPGLAAAALSVPWLLTTGLLALLGLGRCWRRGLGPLEELAIDCGLMFTVVGGGWTTLSRLGARPLDFEDVIVFLTAMHFHYAGLILPVATGLAGRLARSLHSRLAATGVIAGVPLVAAGITTTQLGLGSFLECAASWLTAAACLLTAGLHVKLARRSDLPGLARTLWWVASISLTAGMALAAIYGSRAYFPVAALDIPWMRALHGSLNSLGFSLPAVMAWLQVERHHPPQNSHADPVWK